MNIFSFWFARLAARARLGAPETPSEYLRKNFDGYILNLLVLEIVRGIAVVWAVGFVAGRQYMTVAALAYCSLAAALTFIDAMIAQAAIRTPGVDVSAADRYVNVGKVPLGGSLMGEAESTDVGPYRW